MFLYVYRFSFPRLLPCFSFDISTALFKTSCFSLDCLATVSICFLYRKFPCMSGLFSGGFLMLSGISGMSKAALIVGFFSANDCIKVKAFEVIQYTKTPAGNWYVITGVATAMARMNHLSCRVVGVWGMSAPPPSSTMPRKRAPVTTGSTNVGSAAVRSRTGPRPPVAKPGKWVPISLSPKKTDTKSGNCRNGYIRFLKGCTSCLLRRACIS
mmetsp:Transcript_1347/g.2476  ORF Transcript_1347/g.2476 Transcript_1347/m.2476 type:complete len:212 (-) Transcript_1347:278-913(-)